ncbi:hypothetical protein BH766_gp70 [Gordonia phage Demosthenes]|uniref:Uncharacterized protein n=1 Tax=Gordonia phage Demosthenes TaxID=1838067 RepID=A0A160DE45_9CAUD|nr:hypothetical protein BH766_gp70 [Gordonia phage Demosthenes]ANA86039.1 hypothetical protein PBI_DEMOSTHENES_70 [Gordonia phage Demosthenes]
MTTAVVDLDEYVGRKVSFTLAEEGAEPVQVEATIEATSEQFTFYKPKGKSNGVMVPTAQISNPALAPEAVAELKPRRLNPIAITNIKRHLVDRHGYPLADIDAMTPEAAFEFHESLDHSPLGHFHADPPPKPEEDDDEAGESEDGDDD